MSDEFIPFNGRLILSISVILVLLISVLSTGCMNGGSPLNKEQATIHIASLGGQNDPFTLWQGEPGCCMRIFFFEKEPDGAMKIQSIRESQSKFYFDSTPENAHIILMNGSDGYMSCDATDSESVHECIRGKESTIYFSAQFHVPKGTVIRQYGSYGSKRSDDDSGDISAASYYALYMSPASPASPMNMIR